jgi:hypothetical protein
MTGDGIGAAVLFLNILKSIMSFLGLLFQFLQEYVAKYGASLITAILFWGFLFGCLGIVLTSVFYWILKRWKILEMGFTWDVWVRRVLLFLWLVCTFISMGLAGAILGIERTAIEILQKEKVIEKANKYAAEAIAEPVFITLFKGNDGIR